MNWLARAFGGIRTRMVVLGMIVALPFVVDQLRSIDGDRDAAIEAARRQAEQIAALISGVRLVALLRRGYCAVTSFAWSRRKTSVSPAPLCGTVAGGRRGGEA